MQPIAIQVEQLTYRHKGSLKDALQNISFTVPVGSCTALIGPNGAGKSTLISLLSGLLKHQSGHIQYPQSKQTLKPAIKSLVALVPQEYAFYRQMTVLQNLQYFVGLLPLSSKQQDTRVLLVAKETGLNKHLKIKSEHLSGGYKRRLNLAIALLKSPKILFLDEPTVGIDPVSRDEILTLIKRLKSSGVTIIYTSHLLTEVEDICDEILLLQAGKMRQFDPHSELKSLVVQLNKQVSDCLTPAQIKTFKIKPTSGTKLICQPASPDELKKLLLLLSQIDSNIDSLYYQPQSLTQQYLHLFGQHDSTEH